MHSQKKITWAVLSLLIIFFLAMNYLILKPLVSLPSPLYGGDYYHQLGSTNHVKYGGNPLVSPNVVDSLPIYFVVYPAITGSIAKIFNMEAIAAEFFFSYVILIASAMLMFILMQKLFKNYFISAIATLLFISPAGMPVVKYTDLAYFVMIPLILFTVYNFINNASLKNSILLGAVYGLIGLTHSVAFMASSLLLLSVFLYYGVYSGLFNNSLKFKKNKENKENNKNHIDFKKTIKVVLPYAIVFVIGVSIAMLWWFKPIFVFHGQTPAHYSEWNSQNWASLSVQFKFAFDFIKEMFFSFTDLGNGLRSIFSIIGAFGLFLVKNRRDSIRYVQFLVVASLIITFHYFITQNLFGINFIPNYINYLLLKPVSIVLSAFGVYLIYGLIKKINLKDEKQKDYLVYAYFSVLIILLIFSQLKAFNERPKEKWYAAGINTLPPQLVGLKDYLVKNSNVYDTILTTKEVGFAVNALTGRKLLVVRRAHNDPFMNVEPRELDAGIILYGNDVQAKKDLLKKYDVKYLYWDYYWVQSEYYVNEQGQVTGWFDPLIMFYSQENEATLSSYNISYFKQYTWVDPALKGDTYKQFDLLFISPQNYYNFTHPWKPGLDNYLQEVWNYTSNGAVIGRLYKIVGVQ